MLKKKALSILLSISLSTMLLPVAAFADDGQGAGLEDSVDDLTLVQDTESQEMTDEPEDSLVEDTGIDEGTSEATNTVVAKAFARSTASGFEVGATIGESRIVTSSTQNRIASGAMETRVTSNNAELDRQTIDFLCEVDLSDPSMQIVAGYGEDGSIYGENRPADLPLDTAQTSAQAAAYEAATGNTVVTAINADFFDMSNGRPIGALVVDGHVYNDANGRPYFAILKDGTAAIRYDGDLSDCQWAVGGHSSLLVENGVNVTNMADEYNTNYYVRCAIGIKADGNVVILSAYGLQTPVSCGHTSSEMADLLIQAGCVTGLQLDGGGSVTYLSQYEGSDDLAVRNAPTDGAERFVSSTLFVVSTAKASGEFDHASLAPNGDLFTPGAAVAFSATGVDSYGYAASLPSSGLTWTLSDDSVDMGSIDAQTGVFTSNGTEGDVTVELIFEDSVAGVTEIQIRKPDTISFSSDNIALSYNTTSDLGLTAKYKNQTVLLKDGDIAWSIVESESNTLHDVYGDIGWFDAVSEGSGQGITFHTNVNRAYSGAASITATYYGEDDLTDTMSVEVGKEPVKAMDFEEETGIGKVMYDANSKLFCVYVRGSGDPESEDYTALVTNSYVQNYTTDSSAAGSAMYTVTGFDGVTKYYVTSTRGGNESAEYISTDDPEWADIITKGNGAIKLNYDFTNVIGIEGANLGYVDERPIDGSATSVGMWVYAPEGTPNLWLRLRLKVTTASGTSTVNYLDFTERCDTAYARSNGTDFGGINWTGWKYLEADLTKFQGDGSSISLLPGEVIRVMYTNGSYGVTHNGQTGAMGNWLNDGTYLAKADCKGWLLFDNLTFIYGNNPEDVTNPTIGSICIGSNESQLTEISDGDVIESNTFTVWSEVNDNEDTDENATGITTQQILVDGKLMGSMTSAKPYVFSKVNMVNGQHTITVKLKDDEGNVATKSVTVLVKNPDSAYPTVEVMGDENSPVIGGTYDLNLTTNDFAETLAVSANISIDEKFDIQSIEYAEGYTGSSTFEDGILSLSAQRDSDSANTGEGVIATVKINVPLSLTENSYLVYRVEDGGSTFNTITEDSVATTFSGATQRVPVEAAYRIDTDVLVYGMDYATITVTDANGNPATLAEVYRGGYDGDAELLGTTNENGVLTSEKLVESVASWNVYAKDVLGGYSFPITASCYQSAGDADGRPYHILLNTNTDPETSKTITWMTNVETSGEDAQVEISANEDKSSSWIVKGSSELLEFYGDSKGVRENAVVLTGLEAGATYYYRVGDGSVWSDWREFTMPSVSDEVSFFVLGDTQSEEADKMNSILTEMNSLGIDFAFGAQTGDALENASVYQDWADILGPFSESFGHIDMLHVIGNHELFNDVAGANVVSIFDMPDRDYWSTEYGDVYIANIAYTEDRALLSNAMDWLIADAQASNCIWKVLLIHQPAYYTNPTGGNAYVYDVLPNAAEEAGINVVFAGHDHSYARTNQLTDDAIDLEHGILYYICGSTGEKSYTIATQDIFDYETIFAEATQDYSAIYLTVTADDESMTIETHDLGNGVIDSYTLHSPCGKSGHVYEFDGEKAVCEVCDRKATSFTGEIQDSQGNTYYLLSGEMKTGWITLADGTLGFFKNDGVKDLGTRKIEDVPTTCTERGYYVYTNSAGDTYKGTYEGRSGHDYAETDGEYVCSKCGHVRVNLEDCTATLTQYTYTYDGTAKIPYAKLVAPDGTVLTTYATKPEGTTYYDYNVSRSDNIEVGTSTVTLTATRLGIYVDMSDWRGNYKGSTSVTFEILPDLPTNLSVTASGSTANLTWKAAKAADVTYVIYRSVGGTSWTKVGETTETSYQVAGLKDAGAYSYRLATKKIVDEKVYVSASYTNPVSASKPVLTLSNSASSGKPVLTWSSVSGAAKYQVLRATSATGTYSTIYSTASGTKLTNTGATSGKRYYYKVRALDANGKVLGTSIAKTTVCKPAQPVVTVKKVTSTGKPSLSWPSVTGASEYVIYLSTSENGTYVKLATTTATSFTHQKAVSGTMYYYKVEAVASNGTTSAESKVVSIRCGCAAPTVNVAINATSGKPVITWSKVEGATRYYLYRSTSENGTYTRIFSTTGLKCTNVSAEAGVTYYYKVRAIDADNYLGVSSKAASQTCKCAKPVVTTSNTAKGKPVITWKEIDDAAKYYLYRSTSENGTYTRILATKGLKCTNVSTEAGVTYYYKVAAVTAGGKVGISSEIVSASCRLASPTAKVAPNPSKGNKPKVTWTEVEDAVKYDLYRSTSEDGTYTKIFSTKGLVCTNVSVESGTTYYYKVVAVHADGDYNSAESNTVSFAVE